MKNGMMYQWQMTKPGADLSLAKKSLPEPATGEALVEVAGCGVCHTDLSFWHDGVKTKHALPLTLGHETSGKIIKGPDELVGRSVIIPAVLPCGECSLCRQGKSNICRNQRMPGNDFDGGFASHIVVPAKFLCLVPESVLDKFPLRKLSVIADAISTPYQVIRKSELNPGDLAIVIGVGGVGVYAALLAKIAGAKVIAIDVSDEKLEKLKKKGIDATINCRGLELKVVKEMVKGLVLEMGAPAVAWKIFEVSGTKSGQEMAYSLITYASTLSIVGFTMEKTELRLSNLMAFDAKLIGTWGCKPELYPEVLELIADGSLNIEDFIEEMPMSKINEVFQNSLKHKYTKRVILFPDFN